MRSLRFIACLSIVTTLVCGVNVSAQDETEWISLFDGKTTNGWERVGNEKSVWEVKDGALSGSGPASMLVNTTGPYKNFRYRAEIKISDAVAP